MARTFLTAGLPLALAALVLPQDTSAQGGQDRRAYVQVVADHFGVPTSEAEILLEGRIAIDNLPVVLFVSRETGLSASAVLALRRSATSWSAVSRRLSLPVQRFHVRVPEGDVDERIRRADGLFRSTAQADWDRIELTDEEVVTYVHLRVLGDQLRAAPGAILRARGSVGSWVEVPARMMTRR